MDLSKLIAMFMTLLIAACFHVWQNHRHDIEMHDRGCLSLGEDGRETKIDETVTVVGKVWICDSSVLKKP